MKYSEDNVAWPGWSAKPAGEPGELSVLCSKLPLNLAEAVPVSTLFGWVREEVDSLDWTHPLVVHYLQHHAETGSKAWVSLLVMAYATKVFTTQEIIARCRSDRAFWLLCEGQIPFVDELVSFRRKNRMLITRLLAGVFARFIKYAFGHEELAHIPMSNLESVASLRVDIARHMDRAE